MSKKTTKQPREFFHLPTEAGPDTVSLTLHLTKFQYETLNGITRGSIYALLNYVIEFEIMNHKDARVCSGCGHECWPVTRQINRHRFFGGLNRPSYETEGLHICPKCDKKLSSKTDSSPIFQLHGEELHFTRTHYHYQGMDTIRERLKKAKPVEKPKRPKLLEKPVKAKSA